MAEAEKHGVRHIIAVGFNLETSRNALSIAKKHPGVRASVGIHPHDAGTVDVEVMEQLAEMACEPEVVAIGETGLDFFRDRSPRDAQRLSFQRHIDLARQTQLTLMVHSRDAQRETLDILKQHAGGVRTVLHCFSLFEHIEECVRQGYFMSIAGNVTFPKAAELQAAAVAIPPELLLTETDAPWLTPVPHRGQPNRPAYIPLVLEQLSALRSLPVDDLASQILANFQVAFSPKS